MRRRRRRAAGGIFVVSGLLVLASVMAISSSGWLAAARPETATDSPDIVAVVVPAAEMAAGGTSDGTSAAGQPAGSAPLLAGVAPPPPDAEPPQKGPFVVNYIVLSGDTVSALADHYDITPEEFLALNKGLDPSRLRAGQLVKVPDKAAERGEPRPQFIWPAEGPITTPFGQRGSDWIGGVHPGLDIGANMGDYIWSAADGVIVGTGSDGMGRGYGTYILIYHGNGWHTLYAHLSKVYRGMAYAVRRGEPIGEVGMTGYADGPHLHFEVWQNGERQDPIRFLP